MNFANIFEFGLIKDATKLRMLIKENPDLPICILAGDCANDGECAWMFCSKVSAYVDEILDCEVPYMDCVEDDRVHFAEQIEDWLWDEMSADSPPDEEEFQKRLKEEKEKYEPYWKKCICIYADN